MKIQHSCTWSLRRSFFGIVGSSALKNLLLTNCIVFCSLTFGDQISGYIDFEAINYNHDANYANQYNFDFSVSSEIEYFTRFEGGNQSLTIKPYLRIDQHDDERTQFKFSEFIWSYSKDNYDFGLGLGKVYWGKTEFYHPNNIINQADETDWSRVKKKLGQQMAHLSLLNEWGSLEFFVLPGFNEKEYPGKNARFRRPKELNADNARYESSRNDNHVDWALNLSYSVSGIDLGVSHFDGTGRTPAFIVNEQALPEFELVPYYRQIQQTGIYFQTNVGNWQWKWEAARSKNADSSYLTSTGGLEYTFMGVAETNIDIGLVFEYMADERKNDAPHYYQDDFGAGLRVALNDVQSTEAFVGLVYDRDNDSQVWSVEANRRLGVSWKLEVDVLIFSDVAKTNRLYSVKNDDYLRLSIRRYF